jgi:hydrogenase maturation protease
MGNYSRHESAGSNASYRTAVAGLGNPLHGDDAVGLIVAQSVFEILRHKLPIDLLEWPVPDARLAEHLIGYERAVIIDALIKSQAKVGTVSRVEVAKHSANPPMSLHTTGFQNILALAQLVGMAVPDDIRIYGIVIRQPHGYSQVLSRELRGKTTEIVRAIAAEELCYARKFDRAGISRAPRNVQAEESAEMTKGPP